VHSIADTCNQLILTFGLWQSIKKPNPEHPYLPIIFSIENNFII
jgi:hypothetical protein